MLAVVEGLFFSFVYYDASATGGLIPRSVYILRPASVLFRIRLIPIDRSTPAILLDLVAHYKEYRLPVRVYTNRTGKETARDKSNPK